MQGSALAYEIRLSYGLCKMQFRAGWKVASVTSSRGSRGSARPKPYPWVSQGRPVHVGGGKVLGTALLQDHLVGSRVPLKPAQIDRSSTSRVLCRLSGSTGRSAGARQFAGISGDHRPSLSRCLSSSADAQRSSIHTHVLRRLVLQTKG